MDTLTIVAIWIAQNFGLAGIAIAYGLINVLLVYVAAWVANRQYEKELMPRRINKILGDRHV